MFHHRSSAFATNVSAIEGRLRALENELERIGRTAGRHTSAGMSAAGDHVGDAITSAVRFGNEAAKFGAKFGNDALHRMASEVEHRPLVTLAVAVGVGILIGMAGGMAGRRH